jgi:hypothetical protein
MQRSVGLVRTHIHTKRWFSQDLHDATSHHTALFRKDTLPSLRLQILNPISRVAIIQMGRFVRVVHGATEIVHLRTSIEILHSPAMKPDDLVSILYYKPSAFLAGSCSTEGLYRTLWYNR